MGVPRALALPALALLPQGEVPGLLERDHPLPAWQRAATSLGERGIETELFYTLDLLSNVDGGVREDTELVGNLDVLVAADLEPFTGWRNTRVALYAIANHGAISPAVGDLQGVSSIEGPSTVKLFEAWIETELEGRDVSLLAGIYDVNSEFDVIPSAALFLNGSQGMGGDLGNSGRNGPSTFPFTSLALRVDYQPEGGLYARAVVADGVPGEPGDDKRTHVELHTGDGALIVAEAGYVNVPSERLRGRTRRYADDLPLEERRYGFFGKFALGLWQYTGRFDDPGAPGGGHRHAAPGVYALAEQRVLYERDDPLQGLSLHARVGACDGRTNPVDGYLGGGLVYRGLVPGRDADELGLAVAAAHFGTLVRSAAPGGWDPWEVAIELTYRWRVAPWLSLQPDVQHVLSPGGDPSLGDATVVGVRALVAF